MEHRIKDRIKKAVQSIMKPTLEQYFNRDTMLRFDVIPTVDRGTQILLSLKYKELLLRNLPLPTFDEVGFRAFSQNEEDGILLFIFALIGVTNKRAVEVCAGDGIENNTANLIIHHGWEALLFDGDEENIKRARQFYATCLDTFAHPPTLVHAWVEAENINSLITKHGVEGEIDLLSVDIDGMDYWIWQAIDCIKPRVVVVEYQTLWGSDKAVTVPYDKDFNKFAHHPDYCGASLLALVKLGREKGYRLVGCNRYCFNAFFIRSDIAEEIFPEISVGECFNHPHARDWIENHLPQVSEYNWVNI